MRYPVIAGVVAIFFLAGMAAFAAEPEAPGIEAADSLFRSGKFAESKKLYAELVQGDAKNHAATLRLGEIALLANRLDEAQKWLEKARTQKPEDSAAKVLLAEAHYRRDRFEEAIPLLRAAGQEVKAKKLASFNDSRPYDVQGKGDTTTVKFTATDPLPLVRVRVNGGDEINFFIDTGASEVFLDTEFAKEMGITQFGSEKGDFAGGNQAQVGHGRIDSLKLGDWTLKNLPVLVLNTRQFSKPVFGGKRVDGIIGTVLFYHFIATLDYPKGELILRQKKDDNLKGVEKAGPGKVVEIPFWMAADHFMVAWGQIEKSPPVLLFVDTGAAGLGTTLTESAIKEAGIKLQQDQAGEGGGGGGKVKIIPFVVKDLSLGDVHEKNVRGAFLGPFAFENKFGFRLAGIVSHTFFKPYALTFDFDGMRLLLQC